MAASSEADGRIDLRTLDLRPGEVRTLDVEVPSDAVHIGGSDYVLAAEDDRARIEVNHAHSGWHVRVRVAGELRGPCWRCLEAARVPLSADVRDFARFDRPAGEVFDEDLDSEYVEGDVLDARAMARDALLDGVPSPILCAADCEGLCPTCGARRSGGPCGCPPPGPDSRWEALRDIAARFEEDA